MRTGKKTLKTHTGKTLHFKKVSGLKKYERYNNALKHGWKPSKRK